MRASLLRCLVLAAMLVPAAQAPVQAQTRKPTAQETKLIRDCFRQKGDGPRAEQCIGLVSTRCSRKPGNQGGLNEADCHRIEQVIWDALLNETYRELQGELDEDDKTKLRDMQRAWIASRDATCEFYHVKIQGSMAVPMSGYCFLQETARRALFLQTLRGL
jgi:uncharacterized protein YecT (DUF1311 family)